MFGNAIDLDRFLISDDSVEDQINIVKSMNNQRYVDWADTMILKQHTLMGVALSTQLDNDIYHIQSKQIMFLVWYESKIGILLM